MDRRWIVLFGAIALVIAVWNLATFTVPQWMQAVVVQLGDPVRTVREPGLYFKIPFIQNVIYFDRRLLEYDASQKELLTRDKQQLVVDNYTRWRIVDPLQFFRTVRSEVGAQSRLDDIVYSDLPEKNELNVFNRMRTERERLAKKFRAEGDEEARKIRSQSDKEVQILLADARQQSEIQRGEGDARAVKIFADAYGRDPEFYELVRTLEAYRNTIGPGTTVVLSPHSEFFRLLQGPTALGQDAAVGGTPPR